jgi:dolichol-phosphate mannosyltransferase
MASNSIDGQPLACIVMPTYNEAPNVCKLIPHIFEISENIKSHAMLVLIVDDNSPDGTALRVAELQKNYRNLYIISGKKNGLGDAYRRGFDYAIKHFDPDLILQMDADGQHAPDLLPLFILLSTWDFSLVIGSRFAPGGETPSFNLWRKFLSHFGNWLIRFFGGIPRIHDCTSGYRCIRADIIKVCRFDFLSTRGYSFQSSLICELLRNGAKAIEVPMVFHPRLYGQSKLTFRDQVEFLLNIAKLRFRKSEEFIKFCLVGLCGLIINMMIYIFLTRVWEVHALISSPIAIEISILSNFCLNHLWTFKGRQNPTPLFHKLLRFHLVAGLAGVANFITFVFQYQVLGFLDILANFIGIVCGALINYALNSIWTWKKNK